MYCISVILSSDNSLVSDKCLFCCHLRPMLTNTWVYDDEGKLKSAMMNIDKY